MVKPDPRRNAAELVRLLTHGQITNFTFEENWPREWEESDRGLKAVRTLMLRFLPYWVEYRYAGPAMPSGMMREMFDRCILFLSSDQEYAWPEDDFVYPLRGGLAVLARVLRGRWIASWQEYRYVKFLEKLLAKGGELDAWPFFTNARLQEAMTAQTSDEVTG